MLVSDNGSKQNVEELKQRPSQSVLAILWMNRFYQSLGCKWRDWASTTKVNRGFFHSHELNSGIFFLLPVAIYSFLFFFSVVPFASNSFLPAALVRLWDTLLLEATSCGWPIGATLTGYSLTTSDPKMHWPTVSPVNISGKCVSLPFSVSDSYVFSEILPSGCDPSRKGIREVVSSISVA